MPPNPYYSILVGGITLLRFLIKFCGSVVGIKEEKRRGKLILFLRIYEN